MAAVARRLPQRAYLRRAELATFLHSFESRCSLVTASRTAPLPAVAPQPQPANTPCSNKRTHDVTETAFPSSVR